MSGGVSSVRVPAVEVFDLRGEPCELRPGRWTRHVQRSPADLRGVVLHQWGCEVGTSERNRRRHGEAKALAMRALAAPYTISAGVTSSGVPIVALAHPVERYTFASDAGNAQYLAVGVMGCFPFTEAERRPAQHTAMTGALQAAIGVALRIAASLLGDGAEHAGPWSLITHRQCLNDVTDHAACPGEAVLAAALRSAAVAEGLLVPDAEIILPGATHGKPWPPAWREHLPAPRQVCLPMERTGDGLDAA